MIKPDDGQVVWIEYPQGRHLRARYVARGDSFEALGEHIAASEVANWSRHEHEDTDISDDPKLVLKGKLTRD